MQCAHPFLPKHDLTVDRDNDNIDRAKMEVALWGVMMTSVCWPHPCQETPLPRNPP